jgi:integrase
MQKLVDGKLVEMTTAEANAFLATQYHVPEPARPLTPLEFMERFTKTERKDIRAKSRTNDDLEDFFDLLRAATHVHVDDPRVAAGMDLVVSLGLVTAARKAEVLAPPA